MTATSRPVAVAAADGRSIEQLVAAYFIKVDRPGSESVGALFTDQAELVLGTACMNGREAIAQFLRKREADNEQARRLVRHVPGPMDLSQLGESEAKGYSTVLVFAGVGERPLTSVPPSTICDFEDDFVRVGDQWLFARRQATVLFVGASAATFAK